MTYTRKMQASAFYDKCERMSHWGKSFDPAILLLIVMIGIAGCGYHFQGTKNPLEPIGIRKLYVENFTNNTIRPGMEHTFTSALVREIRKGRVFELVADKQEADGIITGVLTNADDTPSATAVEIDGSTPISVATSFSARVTCAVVLKDTTGRVIFMDTFSGSKSHPASLQLEGRNRINQNDNATTPLINESEQRLAVRFLSEQLMLDAYQKMIDLF